MKRKRYMAWVSRMMIFMFLMGIAFFTGVDAQAAVKVDNGNNSIFTAAEVNLNTTCAGNISTFKEEDWYHFVVPATAKGSYFNIVFGPENDNSMTVGFGWKIFVYRKGEADPFYNGDMIKNQVTSVNFPFGPGEYYIKVVSNGGEFYGFTDENYNFMVKFTDNAHWETEKNNDWASANRIAVNETYHGNLWEEEDEDCYTFALSEPGEVSITCGAASTEDVTKIKAGWRVLLYKENESSPCIELSDIKVPATSNKSTLSAGNYRIRICGNGFGTFNPKSETYDFKINYSAASIKKSKVNVSSAKSVAKKKVYLKWKKNKYADGYKVYRSTKRKKGYKCIATLKKRNKVSYTDKKVKSNKVYYYKVCAYRKAGKKTVYSAYSPVKRVKVK